MDWKLASFLRPEWLESRDIWLVGVGALGFRYLRALVPVGPPRIHVIDDDIVEMHNAHNVPEYGRFVGRGKVDACIEIARGMRRDVDVVPHHGKATAETSFTGIVLFGLDSMKPRSDLSEAIKAKSKVSFLGDGRMGATGGRAYGLDPNNISHAHHFGREYHMKVSAEEELGGCVQTPAAGPTADIVAGMVLWKLGRWLHLEQGCMDPYYNYTGFEQVPEPYFEVEQW